MRRVPRERQLSAPFTSHKDKDRTAFSIQQVNDGLISGRRNGRRASFHHLPPCECVTGQRHPDRGKGGEDQGKYEREYALNIDNVYDQEGHLEEQISAMLLKLFSDFSNYFKSPDPRPVQDKLFLSINSLMLSDDESRSQRRNIRSGKETPKLPC